MRSPKKEDIITVRVDAETKAELIALAAADDRTLSAFISRILRTYLDGRRRAKPSKGK